MVIRCSGCRCIIDFGGMHLGLACAYCVNIVQFNSFMVLASCITVFGQFNFILLVKFYCDTVMHVAVACTHNYVAGKLHALRCYFR